MRVNSYWGPLAACLALYVPIVGSAAVAWDESISGDLSNSGLAPSPIAVSVGSNIVTGTVGNAGLGIDRDYFTFAVPQNAVLSAITVLPNSRPAGVSFIGVQAGPQITVSTSGVGAQNLLGWTHFGSADIGTNILPTMLGVYTPLPAGTYSFWVQETGETVPYGFDFSITPGGTNDTGVSDGPLPLWSVVALGVGLVGIQGRRLARRRTDRAHGQ